MIKINIVAVGKVKEKYITEGIEEYKKRLSRYCKFEIKEVKEENFTEQPTNGDIIAIQKKEGENILSKTSGFVILADVKGKKVSSEQLAEIIKKQVDKGEETTFVIGGSYGVSEQVKNEIPTKISFSDMTFTHTMARLLLTEQIYRAFKINENGRYHK